MKPSYLASVAAIGGAVLMLTAVSAQAALIRVDYTVSFYPPNPCSQTSLGDLAGRTLGGTLKFYHQESRATDVPDPSPGPLLELTGIACGSETSGSFSFGLDLGASAALFLDFTGSISIPSPGPPELPVFAFLPSDDVSNRPESAPLLELGTISAHIPDPGPPDLPLYAFASPGHLVGHIAVSFATVPEPSALLLAGAGLAGFALARRRSRAAPILAARERV